MSCGKECCEKCASTAITIRHPGQRRFAADEKWACSAECKRKFEEQVLDYPLEDLGTDRDIESDCIRNELWYKAVLSALNKNDLVWKEWTDLQGKFGTKYAMNVITIHKNDLWERFSERMRVRARPQDETKISEKELEKLLRGEGTNILSSLGQSAGLLTRRRAKGLMYALDSSFHFFAFSVHASCSADDYPDHRSTGNA